MILMTNTHNKNSFFNKANKSSKGSSSHGPSITPRLYTTQFSKKDSG